MKIIYLGTDIYPDVAVNRCWYDSYAGDKADELCIRFNDATKVWDAWQPEHGGIIQAEHEKVRSGKMFIYSCRPENGLFTIRARSLPESAYVNHVKSYDNVRFNELAGEIASRHGLTLETYGTKNNLYGYVEQRNISDIELLNSYCILEGYAVIAHNGKLIIYDEQYMEGQTAAGKIEVGADDNFKYDDSAAEWYGSCKLTNGGVTGSYSAGSGRELSKRCCLYAADSGEMTRFARGLLRYQDKGHRICYLSGKRLYDDFSAGSVLTLSTVGAASWDGDVFVAHIRHDLTFNLSQIDMRIPLGW